MGHACVGLDDDYDSDHSGSELRRLPTEGRVNFATVQFTDFFSGPETAEDFWLLAEPTGVTPREVDDAFVRYAAARRYIADRFEVSAEDVVDPIFIMVRPLIQDARHDENGSLDDVHLRILEFISFCYLFYRYSDVSKLPGFWLFYWHDAFFNCFAPVQRLREGLLKRYRLTRKELRYLFGQIDPHDGWVSRQQWLVILSSLQALDKHTSTTPHLAYAERSKTLHNTRHSGTSHTPIILDPSLDEQTQILNPLLTRWNVKHLRSTSIRGSHDGTHRSASMLN
ncbi:hypothetical protein GMRT_13792 [Giardia muris]|uniref:Uncharacterized protein n=1 Tax=Giardia muris TaxID=5742 RepID=A0A4Z1T6H6_GIAMU|nr:hypothetical protein GMRT_13792 [Giardia muris]|eukprot:TNJ28737.1 hypothetical protein GMRT_13792 [Giardia muris]